MDDGGHVASLARGYLSRLSPADLRARGFATLEGFEDAYRRSFKSFLTAREVAAIDEGVRSADVMVQAYPRIFHLPWKIAVLSDERIEDGWPHTHGDVIVLTPRCLRDGADLPTILVHEKVHVFQRAYPVETHILFCKAWGLKIASFAGWRPHAARANPDISELSYSSSAHPFHSCAMTFNSTSPRNLSDARIRCATPDGAEYSPNADDDVLSNYEHPNEAMAYMIADAVQQQQHGTNVANDGLLAWMRAYL